MASAVARTGSHESGQGGIHHIARVLVATAQRQHVTELQGGLELFGAALGSLSGAAEQRLGVIESTLALRDLACQHRVAKCPTRIRARRHRRQDDGGLGHQRAPQEDARAQEIDRDVLVFQRVAHPREEIHEQVVEPGRGHRGIARLGKRPRPLSDAGADEMMHGLQRIHGMTRGIDQVAALVQTGGALVCRGEIGRAGLAHERVAHQVVHHHRVPTDVDQEAPAELADPAVHAARTFARGVRVRGRQLVAANAAAQDRDQEQKIAQRRVELAQRALE